MLCNICMYAIIILLLLVNCNSSINSNFNTHSNSIRSVLNIPYCGSSSSAPSSLVPSQQISSYMYIKKYKNKLIVNRKDGSTLEITLDSSSTIQIQQKASSSSSSSSSSSTTTTSSSNDTIPVEGIFGIYKLPMGHYIAYIKTSVPSIDFNSITSTINGNTHNHTITIHTNTHTKALKRDNRNSIVVALGKSKK